MTGAPGARAASTPRTGGSGSQTIGSASSGMAATASGVADQRQHRLAAVADLALGQHGLVLQVGVDAEAVAAGNVRRREDADRQGTRCRPA